jgi:hypothetical protein
LPRLTKWPLSFKLFDWNCVYISHLTHTSHYALLIISVKSTI